MLLFHYRLWKPMCIFMKCILCSQVFACKPSPNWTVVGLTVSNFHLHFQIARNQCSVHHSLFAGSRQSIFEGNFSFWCIYLIQTNSRNATSKTISHIVSKSCVTIMPNIVGTERHSTYWGNTLHHSLCGLCATIMPKCATLISFIVLYVSAWMCLAARGA